MPPKISLVIPTRERANYLAVALHSALLAADKAGCPVEIVVSDNASADDTASVMARFDDPRIVKLRSDRRLSMRENYEFALSHATGSHFLFIGDDDAVLPNGLRILADLIAQHDPDIVKWRVLNYLWPDPATRNPGRLKIRPQVLDGRVRWIAPEMALDRFCQGNFRSYHEGGMIYHGCVARRLVEKVVQQGQGPYFRGSSPDVFTSLQALMVTERQMVHINLPVSLGGASPRSNGAVAQLIASSGASAAGTEFDRFITESRNDPWQCRLPAGCQSLEMVVLDCLQTAATVQGKSFQIDLAAWRKRIADDIATFSDPARGSCLALAKEVFGMQIDLPPLPATAHHVTQQQSDLPLLAPVSSRHAVVRHRPTTLAYSGGLAMSDAARAASMLDRLLDLGSFHTPTTGFAGAVRRIAKIHARARLAVS